MTINEVNKIKDQLRDLLNNHIKAQQEKLEILRAYKVQLDEIKAIEDIKDIQTQIITLCQT